MSAHVMSVSRTASALSFFGRAFRRSRTPHIDVRSLPDHLKRDLGFLGGRDAAPRNLLRD